MCQGIGSDGKKCLVFVFCEGRMLKAQSLLFSIIEEVWGKCRGIKESYAEKEGGRGKKNWERKKKEIVRVSKDQEVAISILGQTKSWNRLCSGKVLK